MSRYIDVNMLIKKYIDTDIKKFSNSDVKIVLENLKQNILKAPTIEPKRGEWRYVGNSIELMWECPQCGYKVFGFERELPNFCGNCGCDMRKESE